MTTVGDQYLTLRSFLGPEFLSSPDAVEANSEASKQRMGRLNQQQFTVFTIDLIDEILRRREGANASAHLPARQDFHPKRNQTRQKLASLAILNFKKMACDVFFELERRFPNLVQEYPQDKEPDPEPASKSPASVTSPATIPPAIQPRTPLPIPPPIPATPTPKLAIHSRNPSNGGRSIDEVMADLGDLVSPSRMAALNGGLYGASGGDSGILKDPMVRMRKDNKQRTEALNSRIEVLEGELEGTKAALEAARKEANEVGEEYLASAKEADAMRKELNQFKSEGGDVRKEVTGVRKELSESRAESTSLRAEMSQLRQTLQTQLSEITTYKKELADANRRHQDAANESVNLKAEIALLRQEIVKHKAEYQKQIADYIALKADYADIKSHMEDQQTLFGEVRGETTSLLAEVKNLTTKNNELREINEGLLEKNEETLRVTDELKDQYEELSRHLEQVEGEKESLQNQILLLQSTTKKSTPMTPATSSSTPMKNPSTTASNQQHHESKAPTVALIHDGVLDKSAARAYQSSVEEVLRAVRSTSKASVLPAIKSLISACKQATESFEEFETLRSVRNGRRFAKQAQLEESRGRLSNSLAALIAAAKAFLASGGGGGGGAGAAAGNGPERVEESISQLTLCVNEVAGLLKLKAQQDSGAIGQSDDDDNGDDDEEGVSFYGEVQELKEFVEGQTATIVEGIQGLLGTMRTGNNNNPAAFVQELDGKVNAVVGIVKNMYKAGYGVVSRMPPDSAFRLESQEILNNLNNSRRRLETFVGELGKTPQSKEVRQGIATAAYDLAKLVKNFVALLDGYEE
ncbi:component of the polarisome [Chytriomyces hyalinus]|nr:component of the polarisome [Chytriomyces hyalinus]